MVDLASKLIDQLIYQSIKQSSKQASKQDFWIPHGQSAFKEPLDLLTFLEADGELLVGGSAMTSVAGEADNWAATFNRDCADKQTLFDGILGPDRLMIFFRGLAWQLFKQLQRHW